jgi:hypothetical protein
LDRCFDPVDRAALRQNPHSMREILHSFVNAAPYVLRGQNLFRTPSVLIAWCAKASTP